jgi:hypothetical protein
LYGKIEHRFNSKRFVAQSCGYDPGKIWRDLLALRVCVSALCMHWHALRVCVSAL